MEGTALHGIAEKLCGQIDWQYPELAKRSFAPAFNQGGFLAAARGFVRYLRERSYPVIGATADYLTQFRAAATPEMLRQARKQLDLDLAKEHSAKGGFGGRGSVITSFPEEALFLAATENDLRLIGEILAAEKDDWGKNGWGTTHYICNTISRLWPLANCPDDTFIPFLALLPEQAAHEWEWAKSWNESGYGSSGHNWWATTFSGFWMAGLMFPELKGLEQFRAFAPEWLERETRILFEADGFTKERSGYHWNTAEEIYLATSLAERNGIHFSHAHHERLRAIAAANWMLITPDGDIPHPGDGCKAHTPGWLLERLRADAARHNMGEAKWVAEKLEGGWQPPAAWNGAYHSINALTTNGELLQTRYNAVVPQPPATLDTVLPHSGYYCIRSDWSAKADYACIDAGARGNIVSSHDHTAIFHLLLHSRGRPILVDNFRCAYGNTPGRTYRIGSGAHNVATVDGQDQIPMNGEWRWHMPVLPYVNDWISQTDYSYFNGTHEGYARLPKAVPGSRRKVFCLRGKYWILIDRFTASNADEPHSYRQLFHTATPASLAEDGRLVTSGEGGNLLILPVEGASGTASFSPHPYPLQECVNPAELCYTRETQGHGLFVTMLIPFENDKQPVASAHLLSVEADGRIVSPWEISALAINIDGHKHVYVDQHMEWNLPWSAGGFNGHGRLFHSEVMAQPAI